MGLGIIEISILAFSGAVGTLSRVFVQGIASKYSSPSFIYDTLAVNLIGAFFAGVLWEIVEYKEMSFNTRLFIFVGLLGCFTTFSAFALENIQLMRAGFFKSAILNITISNVGGLFLAFLGSAVTRYFLGR